ncbi:hypothetical protein GCM10023149_20930 [Mucilaginibacter gynuensis]|uniref:WGR domain-containing protein n=1 Tax=Mucilaginibacter gynuensis TaxID=1302236 RepID=A0ABP8GBE4_9SPHI
MLKLYKNDNGTISYWETWDKDSKNALVHWGVIGNKGQSKEVKSGLFKSFKKEIQQEIDQLIAEGYGVIDTEDHYTLLIEYIVDGMGTLEDVEKRYSLENLMNEVLGWTGLGHSDGGSIGSGTMEVCCLVVDFEIAKQVIEKALQDTQFANYSRIYDENEM